MSIQTRSMKKRSVKSKTTKTARKTYRKRVKASGCRKASSCRKARGCKATKSGKRKSYCRKVKNTRRK